MNKVLRYLKEMALGFFYLVAGLLVAFFPKIAKMIDLPFVNTEELVEQKWHIIVGLSISLISFIVIIYRILHAKKLCIIKVDGMNGKRIEAKALPLLASQEFDCYRVNLRGEFSRKNIYQAYAEMRAIFNVNKEKGFFDEYCFYGFTYTPFLFMLGRLYSDNRNYSFYHMEQSNGFEKRIRLSHCFERKDGNDFNEPVFTDRKSKTLTIRVGTTVPPDMMNISQFGETDVLDFSSRKTGTEVINSQKRLFKWCDIIVDRIRAIEAGKYETINLLLATSAEMVFLLGKRLSKNADPNLCVYHYDANAKFKYSWALQSTKANAYDDIVVIFNSKNIRERN